MYTHFKRHVDTLVNVAQAVVRRNQKCLDADIAEVKRDLYSSFVIGIYFETCRSCRILINYQISEFVGLLHILLCFD
jgi:hypothetical protein